MKREFVSHLAQLLLGGIENAQRALARLVLLHQLDTNRKAHCVGKRLKDLAGSDEIEIAGNLALEQANMPLLILPIEMIGNQKDCLSVQLGYSKRVDDAVIFDGHYGPGEERDLSSLIASSYHA